MRLLGADKLKALGHAGGIGFEMVAMLLVGLYAGKWLDGRFGTDPAFKLIGLFFGIGAGFYSLFKLSKELSKGAPKTDSTLDPGQTTEEKVSNSEDS